MATQRLVRLFQSARLRKNIENQNSILHRSLREVESYLGIVVENSAKFPGRLPEFSHLSLNGQPPHINPNMRTSSVSSIGSSGLPMASRVGPTGSISRGFTSTKIGALFHNLTLNLNHSVLISSKSNENIHGNFPKNSNNNNRSPASTIHGTITGLNNNIIIIIIIIIMLVL
jgi:hypothetical protein